MNNEPPMTPQAELAEALLLLDRVTTARDSAEQRAMALAIECDKLRAEIQKLQTILNTFDP